MQPKSLGAIADSAESGRACSNSRPQQAAFCIGRALRLILQLLITMLRAAGWLERLGPLSGSEKGQAINRLLAKMDPTIPLVQVVQQSGYHRDHLNRLLKRRLA